MGGHHDQQASVSGSDDVRENGGGEAGAEAGISLGRAS